MRKSITSILSLALGVLVVSLFFPQASAPARAASGPDDITVPAGTDVTVRMIDAVDSSKNHAGEEFAAVVEAPVAVGDHVAIPKGAEARVRLVEAKSAGRIKGRSELELELVELKVNGTSYPVESSVSAKTGASRGKRSAEVIGGGAGLGALLGAALGKGKGAAEGAAIGAASGTAVQAATHGEQVKVPAEAKVDFVLKQDVTLRT